MEWTTATSAPKVLSSVYNEVNSLEKKNEVSNQIAGRGDIDLSTPNRSFRPLSTAKRRTTH